MKYTENYKFKMPDGNDYVSVDDINDNFDAVDKELAQQKSDFTEHKEHGVNNNILINSNFANPVNQRGQTEYTAQTYGHTYTFDRWVLNYTGTKAIIIDNVLQVSKGETTNDSVVLYQKVEHSKLNETYTLSVKVDGVIRTFTFTYNGGSESIMSDKIYLGATKMNGFMTVAIGFFVADMESINIEWAKLEIGDHATPYVPRLYAEEWLLCQRYYKRVRVEKNPYGISGSNIYVRHLLDAENMRSHPTIKVLNSALLYEAYDYDNFVGSIVNTSGLIVTMQYTKENHGRTDLSKLCDSAYFELDAEL